ncbi:MAG: metallophosphoesterase [Christensenellaceae bacterium]|jgi:predicted phosphodiesterase|nr:metallophosphoesterase [Christensenellaceae bacterium]
MAIAVFADIHGNLEALQAILKSIKRKGIKQVYFLGDAITFGPDSLECLKLLAKSGVRCIIGNHEQRMLRYDKSVAEMSFEGTKHMEDIRASLDNEALAFIKSLPLEIKTEYKGYKIAFTHYSHDKSGVVRDDYEEFSEPKLIKLFDYLGSDIVFFGHIHHRKIIIDASNKSFMCLGSSGCVHGDKTFWTYFDIKKSPDSDANLDFRRIMCKFNRKKFEKKVKESELANNEKFAKKFFNVDI